MERISYATLPNSDSVIDVVKAGADNTGEFTVDSVIQTLVNQAHTKTTILYFPSGTYTFKNTLKLRSNIILRGVHSDSTILKFNLGGRGHSIEVRGTHNSNETMLSNEIHALDRSFKLDQVDFKVGQTIQLIQNDSNWITSSWAKNTIGQFLTIDSIKENKVYTDQAIRHDYFTSLSPRISSPDFIQNVGFENLKIVRADATNSQTSNILFKYAKNCWVYGLHFDSANFGHVTFDRSYKNLVTGCYFENAFNYGGGGKAYGVVMQNTSCDHVIENNIFRNLRHSILLQAGANGNIVAYNYSREPFWTGTFFPSSFAGDLVLHGNYVYSNLFEGNVVQNIVIDDSHGINGPRNTFLRNRAEHAGIFMNRGQASDSQLFIGNEITGEGQVRHNSFKFPKGLYSLAGKGHFEYGNFHGGSMVPGTIESLTESYYRNASPEFWTKPGNWPGIGYPIEPGTGIIPAQERFEMGKTTVPRGTIQSPSPLYDLKGTLENKQVILSWKLNKSVSSSKFEVERLDTGFNQFSLIGEIDQAIISENSFNYLFKDARPALGKNTYRIKQINANGSILYSKKVSLELKKTNSARVLQEWGSNQWYLQLLDGQNGEATISIIALNGALVHKEKITKSENLLHLNLDHLEPATYLIQVQLEGKILSYKTRVH